MSFLERAIRRGISKGVGDAIGKAVQQAVEPAATELVNKAAGSIEQAAAGAAPPSTPTPASTSGLEQAFGNLQRSAERYATEAAKNVKICPACGQACDAEQKFCQKCGAQLPAQTLAEGAVCPGCGKQNTVGTRFCVDCGTKLPSAIAEEQAAERRNSEVMAEWNRLLPQYPKWNCGGSDFNLEILDAENTMFAANFAGDRNAAQQAVFAYRQLVRQYGFRPAGEYPSEGLLYSKTDGICRCIDTDHCFDGDPDCPTIYFYVREPAGGFDYVKPEPKKKASLRDLFNF